MAQEDQRIRREFQRNRGGTDCAAGQWVEWEQIDAGNVARLQEIIEHYGWPGWCLVGERGARSAWLIAQHADGQPDFQREALRWLADAVARNDASPRNLAYLTDRVRMNEGRDQLYGTQMRALAGGTVTPWPIEDEEHLDQRRAQVGMEPFDDYLKLFDTP